MQMNPGGINWKRHEKVSERLVLLLNEKQKQQWGIWGLILLITSLWGYGWVPMKTGLNYMGPAMFTALRFMVGAITLLIVAFLMKLGLPKKRYWKHLFLVGLLQTTAVFLLVMYGLNLVDAGKSSVLLYSMPLWSSILAVPYLKEKLTWKQLTGLFLGMIGLLIILGWDIWSMQDALVVSGELLIILASVIWAISNIYFRLHLAALPKVQSSAYQMTFGAVVLLVFALIAEWGEPVMINASSLYDVIYSGVIASALCFTVWYLVLSKINMVTATIATLLVPVFGLFFSALLLAEEITLSVIVGAGFIIYGIIRTQLKKKTKDTRVNTNFQKHR